MALPTEHAYALPPSNSSPGTVSKESLVYQEMYKVILRKQCNNNEQHKCTLILEWVNCGIFIHDIYKAVKVNNYTKNTITMITKRLVEEYSVITLI